MSIKKLKVKPALQREKIKPIYHIIIDEYLQPKKKLNFEEKSKKFLHLDDVQSNEVNLKQRIGERWHILQGKQPMRRVVKVRPVNSNSVNSNEHETQRKLETIKKLPSVKLLRYVTDALGRRKIEETRIRKSKTGFDIYCGLASVHGLKNLVGATTCQRVFWYFTLCVMLYLSILLLLRSIGLHADDPTILYVETTTGTTWGSSFPSVTLCNLNRISKKKIEELLKEDRQATEKIRPYLQAVLYNTLPVSASPEDFRLLQTYLDSKNYTHSEFLRKISPDCMSQLLRCKLHGQMRPCSELFKSVENHNGFCCSFTYHTSVHEDLSSKIASKMHSNRFSYKWGLTILIDPEVYDYLASRHKLAGYQIFTRAPVNNIAINMPYQLAFPRKEIHVHVTPLTTVASPYVGWHNIENRRCYMPFECKLLTAVHYTQANCYSECRSWKMWTLCGCVPPLWPRAEGWLVCTLAQASCVISHYDVFTRAILLGQEDYKINPKAENYVCRCYPTCDLTLYKTSYDVTPIDRNNSINDLEFYRGIELKDHLVAHIFYADKFADVMRLDVYNNWQTYFGMFGGITSLHLGYSFISGFEIIFFLFVRPISNWLMRRNNATPDAAETKNVVEKNTNKQQFTKK